jgi:type II secretory pathway pseudopilin PulG
MGPRMSDVSRTTIATPQPPLQISVEPWVCRNVDMRLRGWWNRVGKSELGMGVMLIEVMIVMLILMVLAAMSLPNLQRLRISQDQKAAAEMVKRINHAITYHSQLYSDGFRSPTALAATAAFPKTCENSGLLSGTDALPTYAHYTFTFIPGPSQAPLVPGCNFAGYTTFRLQVSPTDPSNKRTFFLDESSVVRYSDGTQADAFSAAWMW